MIKYHFKSAIRNLFRKRIYSGINIAGLSIGITCVIFISIWVQNELSFDKFHKKHNNIYRVLMDLGEYGNLAITPPPLIDKMKNDFPEIVAATRVNECPKVIVKNGDMVFNESKGIFTDKDFMKMFSFNLLQGDINGCLESPSNIVLTQKMAKKYFEDANPINKTIEVKGFPLTISGILEDVPQNSHLQFDFIIPIEILNDLGEDLSDWGNVNLHTYIEVKNNVDFAELNEKILSWKTPRREQFYLQPLINIHTDTDLIANNAVITQKSHIKIFSIIAILILLIASVNYITLYTSAATKRNKEIGIRKISGSTRKGLVFQFLMESAVNVFLAFIIAIFIVKLLSPQFNVLIGKQLEFQFLDFYGIKSSLVVILFILMIIGLCPAFILSSMKPAKVLKGKATKIGLISNLKNTMVFTQFAISIILIVGILTISKQLKFIQTKDLGFQKENVVYLPFNEIGASYHAFKQDLLNIPTILNVSAKNSIPTETADKTDEIYWQGKEENQNIIVEATGVDYDYFETMNLSMVDGRSFSTDFPSDNTSIILNQKAVEQMGMSNPVGKKFKLWEYSGLNIIGVVNDANFYSLKQNIEPQVYYMLPEFDNLDMASYGVLMIKIDGKSVQQTISSIEEKWDKFYPDVPFDLDFLDSAINNLYKSDLRLAALIKYFALLSILISCLGLLGMANFTVNERVKEIGVRKVNGAKIREILAMLNFDFIKWVIIALSVSCPIAWYLMTKWLQNFAYKTDISWWIFASAGAIALVIAMFTISWQSFRAASRNPVEALRYE